MPDRADGRPWTVAERVAITALPLLKLGIHAWVGTGWGWFRDEFYYLACADRLDWGYVDHPPLSIALLAGWRALFGPSLEAMRLLPAVAGALLVLLTGLLTRRLGGHAWTMMLAMLAVIASPIHLSLNHFVSMNALELVFWSGAAFLVANLLEAPTTRRWLVLGVVIGLGLLNKYSMSWFAAGLGIGILLTSHRRLLRTPGPWLAALLAGLLQVPHLLWQQAHGWPTREFMHNAATEKMAETPVTQFIGDQVLCHNPVLVPLGLAGLVWLLASPAGRRWAPLAWIYLATMALLVISGRSRPNYLTPAYAPLFAAGSVAFCAGIEWLAGRTIRWRLPEIVSGGYLLIVVAAGALLAPLALPILPVEEHIRYQARLGIAPQTNEQTEVRRLSQFFADQLGWPEMVAEVARAWNTIPTDERARARIFTSNYGQAGAIQVLGPALGLPTPISGHNNYWLWGPGDWSGDILVVYGDSREDAESAFAEVVEIGRVKCPDCMPYEDDNPILLCRRPRFPVSELWPRTKEFH